MNDSTRRNQVGNIGYFLQFKKILYMYVQENLGDLNEGIFYTVFKQDLTSYFYLLAYLSSYHEKATVRYMSSQMDHCIVDKFACASLRNCIFGKILLFPKYSLLCGYMVERRIAIYCRALDKKV